MRVIVETATGLSKYVFADNEVIVSLPDHIKIGDPLRFIIGDLGSGDVTITDNVTNVPQDWIGNKYLFDGTTWTLNPNWVEEPPA